MNTSEAVLPASLPAPFKQDASIIALVGLAHASSHFSQLLLPLMFPVFIKEFGLTYSELGLLMAAYFVISGLGQAGTGFVVDRLGARPLLFMALGIFVLACGVASRVTGYGGLLTVAALAGLGNATFHPVDFTILSLRVSNSRMGHAFSAHGLAGYLGWAAAPLFFGTLGSWYHWRTVYLCAAALYVCILVLFILMRDKLSTPVATRHADAQAEHSMAFLRLPVVWWCFGFFLLAVMTTAVMQNYSIPILKAMQGVSFEAATLTLTVYMLCSALGMFVGGFVAVRIVNSDHVVAVAMAVGSILLALCGSGILGALATMVVLASTGIAIGIGGPSRDMMIRRATPKGATGRVFGLVYSGMDVGSAISPVLFGVFMDRGWYGATLVGAAVVLAFSVVAALGVGRLTSGHPQV